MPELEFKPGEQAFLTSDSAQQSLSVCFEDDGETGYFYALDRSLTENTILDAMHIYNVSIVADRDRTSTLTIVWSEDGLKCALVINGHAHAAFDFSTKRGFCKTNFPNFQSTSHDGWNTSNHSWSDEAIAWMK